MKLKWKILLSPAITLILMIALLTTGILDINKNITISDEISNYLYPRTINYHIIETCALEIQKIFNHIAAVGEVDNLDDLFYAAEQKFRMADEKFFFMIEKTKEGSPEREELLSFQKSFYESYEKGKAMANTFVNEGVKAGMPLMEDFSESSIMYYRPVQILVDDLKAQLDEKLKGMSSRILFTRTIFIAGAIIAILLSVIISIVTTMRITTPLRKVTGSLKDLSEGEGNLTYRLKIKSGDEIGKLSEYFNKFMEKLKSVIIDVKEQTEALYAASGEINSSGESLSQSTNEQAANIEEFAASLEEMSATISQNYQNSKITNELAQNTASQAEKGGQEVDKTVTAMRQITEKITAIEVIASQTNLLALNAAIEAARAGESGKGFAVVASEVRKLAENSQKISKEISELSTESVDIAENAGKIIDEIVPGIKQIADHIQNISDASEEQNNGINEITSGVDQLNTVTQENASLSEELAASASTLNDAANRLNKLMVYFKTEERRISEESEIPEKEVEAEEDTQWDDSAASKDDLFIKPLIAEFGSSREDESADDNDDDGDKDEEETMEEDEGEDRDKGY